MIDHDYWTKIVFLCLVDDDTEYTDDQLKALYHEAVEIAGAME